MMDGKVAQSMRDKGLDYHLNWGATLPRLREKADMIGNDYDLAIALWKENIRECKILATMIMPPNEVQPEVIDIWMEQTPTQEIAEQAAFNLYQHLPFAPENAPLILRVPVRRINWGYETEYRMVARALPLSSMPIGPAETVEFIPYGCTDIRMTEIPVAEIPGNDA